jgi:hypothetical protein
MSRVEFWRALRSFALSVTLVCISHTVTFNHLAENIQSQYATILGLPFLIDGKPQFMYPLYDRILFPAVFILVANTLSGRIEVQVVLWRKS